MSDITLINSMIDRGILQRYNDGYAVEHNGKAGIQTEENVPEDINGEAGYQAEDILDYVVYNVDQKPIIDKYEIFVQELESDTDNKERYLERFRIREEGKYILSNDVVFEAEEVRRSEGYISAFLSEVSQPVRLFDGRIVMTKPEEPVYLTRQGFLKSGYFEDSILFKDIPLLGDVYSYGAQYQEQDGSLFLLLFEEPREIETNLGRIQYKYFSWNNDFSFRIFAINDAVYHYNQDILRLNENSGMMFYFDTLTPLDVFSFGEMVSTVSLPNGQIIDIVTDTLDGVAYYRDGSLKECSPKEDLELVINGQTVIHKANNPLWFYPNGNLRRFVAREPVVMELITGERMEVSTSFIGVMLDNQGKVYKARFSDYYFHECEDGKTRGYKFVVFDKETGEFVSGSP